MPDRLRVVIGIPTYRRPEKLAELLDALPARIAEVAHAEISVVVVDNDPAETARTVVAAAQTDVRYAVEPTPGIAAVRNRLIDEAGDARLLSFIDDDERPLEGWLATLIATWRDTTAAAVMGRVISIFEDDVDPWILATGVFRRRERATGLQLAAAAAGNLLIDLAQVRELGIRFDPTLGLAGGEDTLFSRSLIAAGGKIVWCNESRAEDFVPRERLTRRWAMRRGFNGGNSAVDVELRLEKRRSRRAAVRVRRFFGGFARAVTGWLQHLWGILTGDLHHDARGLRTAYRGMGMVAAAVGHRHREYSRTERG